MERRGIWESVRFEDLSRLKRTQYSHHVNDGTAALPTQYLAILLLLNSVDDWFNGFSTSPAIAYIRPRPQPLSVLYDKSIYPPANIKGTLWDWVVASIAVGGQVIL